MTQAIALLCMQHDDRPVSDQQFKDLFTAIAKVDAIANIDALNC
jgi:hypothetical protein